MVSILNDLGVHTQSRQGSLLGGGVVNKSEVVQQLEAQLSEQRKRRRLGDSPSPRSMQLTSPALNDLGITGLTSKMGF